MILKARIWSSLNFVFVYEKDSKREICFGKQYQHETVYMQCNELRFSSHKISIKNLNPERVYVDQD